MISRGIGRPISRKIGAPIGADIRAPAAAFASGPPPAGTHWEFVTWYGEMVTYHVLRPAGEPVVHFVVN